MRLLTGGASPVLDAGWSLPGGLSAALSQVLDQARAPAHPKELEGESAVRAMFRAEAAKWAAPRRPRLRRPLVMAGAASATFLLASGGLAAATGFPGPAARIVDQVLRQMGINVHVPTNGQPGSGVDNAQNGGGGVPASSGSSPSAGASSATSTGSTGCTASVGAGQQSTAAGTTAVLGSTPPHGVAAVSPTATVPHSVGGSGTPAGSDDVAAPAGGSSSGSGQGGGAGAYGAGASGGRPTSGTSTTTPTPTSGGTGPVLVGGRVVPPAAPPPVTTGRGHGHGNHGSGSGRHGGNGAGTTTTTTTPPTTTTTSVAGHGVSNQAVGGGSGQSSTATVTVGGVSLP